MIASMTDRVLRQQEEAVGESMDYLRDVARASRSALFKFGLFAPLARHRTAASPAALAVARLVATRHEDCGPCLQTCVRLASGDGVDAEVIRAVLASRPEDLDAPLARVYRYAEAVASAALEATELAAEIAAEQGEKALVDLALAIASVRVFPTLKRGLGYAQSCSLITIEV